MGRQEKDRYILEQFVQIYCRGRHHSSKGQLCEACGDLLRYATQRLERCPQDPKPSCKHCTIHCYKPAYRTRMREVMRYAGMRLILHGRLDLLWHYFF